MLRRLFALAIIVFAFIAVTGLSTPAVVHATAEPSCPDGGFSGHGAATYSFTIKPTGGLVVFYDSASDIKVTASGGTVGSFPGDTTIFNPSTSTITVTVHITGTGEWGILSCLVSVNGGAANTSGGDGPLFTDGRLNMDALQTSAIYCMGDGSVRVLVPGTPKWTIAFTASPAEIAAVPTHPAHNTLIKEGSGATLYRLSSGELQVNSTNGYYFIFRDCPKPQ